MTDRAPCPECGWTRCRSVTTWACFQRAYQRAIEPYYARGCGYHTTLDAAGIGWLDVPTSARYDHRCYPKWAVTACIERKAEKKWLNQAFTEWLRTEYARRPPPPEIRERVEQLQAFALLSGWKHSHGAWLL